MLVYLAIQRILTASYEIDALVMLITSGVGVLVNIVMGCRYIGTCCTPVLYCTVLYITADPDLSHVGIIFLKYCTTRPWA